MRFELNDSVGRNPKPRKFNKAQERERSQLWQRFHEITLQFLGWEQDVYVGEKGSGMYWFESEKYGKVVIYPKGDKIHIPDRREWVTGVEEWLKNNIINEKF